MTRALAIALLLLLGVIAWQRGSVWKAQASATSAAAGQKSAEDDLSAAQSEIGQLTTVVAKERADAKAANALAARYEKEKTHAQTESERLVAELRAGNSRLHDRWQAAVHTAALSQAVASASQPDGRADDRYESAGRIIGAADQCDAQVRALQAYARQCGGEP